MRKSLSFHSSVRYFKYIVLVLLFYPLTVLGAQGHITVKGQSITIKEAIMLIEKSGDSLRNRTEEGEYGRLGAGYPPGGIESPFNESFQFICRTFIRCGCCSAYRSSRCRRVGFLDSRNLNRE